MWRRVCFKNICNPAAAGTSSEQGSENRHDNNAHHTITVGLLLLKREPSDEHAQSYVAKARCIALSPIHVSKNEQRQVSPCPFMIFQIGRERLARSIECNAHRG